MVYDPAELKVLPMEVVHDLPAGEWRRVQRAEGYKYIMVNGGVTFKRQFWATFEDDRAGILTRDLIGVDRLMWGSDYPHTEGTFPYSQEQIMKDFMGVPEGEVRQMVAGNAARLYGLS